MYNNSAYELIYCFRYLATGASFKSLGFTFRMGATTVSLIVQDTVKAIWEVLQPVHMKVPTEDTFRRIAEEFYDKWNFPNCLGAIDGKHIRVKCPPHSGSMFYNYKSFFSIVLQAVVDANYRFSIIDVGGYGKQSDGGTFRSSSLFQLLECGRLHIPPDKALPLTDTVVPYVFVGDEAYPLLRNLLKPYSRRNLDVNKEYFNMRLSRARRLVECAFGIINAKFRILWKPIETSPDLADSIIKCICILHNIIIDLEGIDIQNETLETPNLENVIELRQNNRFTESANIVREAYKIYICQNRI